MSKLQGVVWNRGRLERSTEARYVKASRRRDVVSGLFVSASSSQLLKIRSRRTYLIADPPAVDKPPRRHHETSLAYNLENGVPPTMPRLCTSLLRHARAVNPLLPLLLQTCRTIPSAHNELRWLREHVATQLTSKFGRAKDVPPSLRHSCVAKLARQRARGVPLQYILGSQPFGDLDIKCAKGVLIPRYWTPRPDETKGRMNTLLIVTIGSARRRTQRPSHV